jgi:hypothetical protein
VSWLCLFIFWEVGPAYCLPFCAVGSVVRINQMWVGSLFAYAKLSSPKISLTVLLKMLYSYFLPCFMYSYCSDESNDGCGSKIKKGGEDFVEKGSRLVVMLLQRKKTDGNVA